MSVDAVHRVMPESVYSTNIATEATRYSSKGQQFDLMTDDGAVSAINTTSDGSRQVTVRFVDVSPQFQGFLESDHKGSVVSEFNLKSTLTQLGINATSSGPAKFDRAARLATIDVELAAHSPIGKKTLETIAVGAYIGKLVALPEGRRIRSLQYVERLLDGKDMHNESIFVVGSSCAPRCPLELIDGRVVVKIPVHPGVVRYSDDVSSLLPTIGRALQTGTNVKAAIKLHRQVDESMPAVGTKGNVLVVRSSPICMRSMFGRVVDALLPAGLRCTNSNIIEPTTNMKQSDRTFVFHGESTAPLEFIPVELWACECFREYVPFSLRSRLPLRVEDSKTLQETFATAPQDGRPACVFVTKGGLLPNLVPTDWVSADPKKTEGHEQLDVDARRIQARSYMHQQPEYPVLAAISVGDITSDGVLLTRYFPSPVLKSLMLSREAVGRLKSIVFTNVSRSFGGFFSQEDRATLIDLNHFGIRVFHMNLENSTLSEFLRRGDTGMFVPVNRREEYNNATFFGVYGSNLVEGDFEGELTRLLEGVLEIRKTCKHPMLNPDKPMALVTGGGPGAMEVGNRVAKKLGFLSCGLFVDFGSLSRKPGSNINEQKQNPYVEAYMSYRPAKLVERQSDFGLDFPIFLMGGVGTDFEYALEEVRRKVGTIAIHPMVLFGTVPHFANKIGHRFAENRKCGVIKGSEWLSNVSYVVQTGAQALEVYRRFFNGTLPIGGKAPANDQGFVAVPEDVSTWQP